jgi:PTH1 family peptidyl-tRNA hydrolase
MLVSDGLLSRLRRLVGPPEDIDPATQRIRLVVALGNPGEEYAHTRHNVGFWTLNRLAKRHGIDLSVTGKSATGSGTIAGHDVTLAKPRTYVNLSGTAVKTLIDRLKLDGPAEFIVIADDLDLPLGKIRIRSAGGSGGYKGLQSIIDTLRTDSFPRLRIGIGRPVVRGRPSWQPEHVSIYVLSEPPPEERRQLEDAADRAADAIEIAISEGVERAMQSYN